MQAARPEAGAAATPSSAPESGTAQVMGVKTDAAPDRIDGDALERDLRAASAEGLTTPRAQATALARQGVALYAGDLAGRFTKILPG